MEKPCLCSVCGKLATKRCSKCKLVSYCSTDHQKDDWKTHKKECLRSKEALEEQLERMRDDLVKFTIINTYRVEFLEGVDKEKRGFYMIAGKDLAAGETIFNERPAVTCPVLNVGDEALVPCWGCSKQISFEKSDSYHWCSKCGLPLCTKDCESMPCHKNFECQAIRKMKQKLRRKRLTTETISNQYFDIATLRMLIFIEKEPKVWNHFKNLETSARTLTYESSPYYCGDVLGGNGSGLKLSMQYTNNDSKLVLLACKLLCTFWDTYDFNGIPLRALYCRLACLKHDCKANTFTTRSSQSVKLKAAVPIKEGDLLVYDFLQNLWASTLTRQANLLEKHIICACNRCSDKTEFNSYCASFLCLSCDNGMYLPLDPEPASSLSLGESTKKMLTVWKCNQPECEDIISNECIESYLGKAKEEYECLKNNCGSISQAANTFYDICKRQKSLGSTHSILLEVMDDYLQEERVLNGGKDYLTRSYSSQHNYSAKDVVVMRRKLEFSFLLMNYFDKVLLERCIHWKKYSLYVEYGYFILATTAVAYRNKATDYIMVIHALSNAIVMWAKAKEMLVYFAGEDISPDYISIANNLFNRFSPYFTQIQNVSEADQNQRMCMVSLLMAELCIDKLPPTQNEDGNEEESKQFGIQVEKCIQSCFSIPSKFYPGLN